MAKIEDMYPLSPVQQGLLFHSLLAPKAGIYVPQVVLALSGSIDATVLKKAWQQTLGRHAVLRTGFQWEQRDEPFQVVYSEAELAWTELDWSQTLVEEREKKLQAFLVANRREPFNLHRPPLMRLTWIRLAPDTFYLVGCYHHLILDGWSASLLLQEVLLHYGKMVREKLAEAKSEFQLPMPRTRFSDYIAWLNQQDSAAAQRFWQQRFPTRPTGQYLPPAQASHTATPRMDEALLSLSPQETTELKQFAEAHHLTLSNVLLGAFGLLLSRYNNSREAVLGTTVSGRPPALTDANSMVGVFINTLPVRMQIEPRVTIADWLAGIQDLQAETTDFEHVSLREIQASVSDGQPLFDCLFVFESYPTATESSIADRQLRLDSIAFDEWTHFPLTLLVSEGSASKGKVSEGSAIQIHAKYQKPRLSGEVVGRLLDHVKTLLMSFVRSPQGRLCDAAMLTDGESNAISGWNATAQEFTKSAKNLTELLAPNAGLTQEAIRFSTRDASGQQHRQSITYDKLHSQANELARLLVEKNVGPEGMVVVYLERCLELPMALLAILKTGAAYVPLDPSYPKRRLQAICDDVQPSVMITHSGQQLATLETNCPCIDLSEIDFQSCDDITPLPIALREQNSAYIIYTSGSTGTPKGVINTHSAIVNRLLWMQERFQLDHSDRVLHKTPVGFDVSVWEFFWPLLTGATLVVAEPEEHKDSHALVRLVNEEQITTMHFVPPMLDAFLEVPEVADCSSLRRVICSGETLSIATQREFFEKLPHVELHNLYGPTEAAIDVTAWQCAPEHASVPIGYPIANTSIHLLDNDLNEVPIGVEGDLYIGGLGLARGYLGRPALTAESFVPNPFRAERNSSLISAKHSPQQETLYRTGDRAHYRADGAIEFLGRADHQIKIRGQRIELGEIETALTEHPAIGRAVALLREQPSRDPELVAYLVLDEITHSSFAEDPKSALRGHLQQRLPIAMHPSGYVLLEELPLTANGKLDRARLPAPQPTQQQEFIAPQTETEKVVAQVWQEVLKVERTSTQDSFFELGGHSLSATRTNTRLRQRFEVELELRQLFEYPVLEDLANYIDALKMRGSDSPSPAAGQIEIEI